MGLGVMSKFTVLKNNAEQMWQVGRDRRFLRLVLPALSVPGRKEPLTIDVEFDAAAVDRIIERLLVLRNEMLPKPAPARKRN